MFSFFKRKKAAPETPAPVEPVEQAAPVQAAPAPAPAALPALSSAPAPISSAEPELVIEETAERPTSAAEQKKS